MKKKNIINTPTVVSILALIGLITTYLSLPYEKYAFTVWVQIHTENLSQIVIHITQSGGPVTIALVAFILFLIAYTQKYSKEEYIIVLSGVLTFFLIYTIKEITSLPRPIEGLVQELSYRFPSGHTAGALYISLMLFLIFWRHLKHTVSRIAIGLILLIYPIAIGISRVYLGVHTPLDILGGIFTTLFAVSVSLAIVPILTKDS